MLKAGTFLKSNKALGGTIFENVLIILVEKNDEGAIGFVINKPYGRSLTELEEFKHSPNLPVFDGGPVDREHIYLLHRHPHVISESLSFMGNLSWGGNIKDAIQAIAGNAIPAAHVKLLLGYCGWDAGELEKEVAEGSWTIIPGKEEDVF